MTRDPGDQPDEGRLIDITPVEMLTAGQVIKFVSKNPVAIRSEQVKEQFYAGQREDNRRSQLLPR